MTYKKTPVHFGRGFLYVDIGGGIAGLLASGGCHYCFGKKGTKEAALGRR